MDATEVNNKLNLIVAKLQEVSQRQNQIKTNQSLKFMPSFSTQNSGTSISKDEIKELRDTITALTLQIQEIACQVIANTTENENQSQYQKRNYIILHGLQDLPKTDDGKECDHMEFQKYNVGKLNLFNLGIKINNRDIDAAHLLKPNSRSGTVIIKFILRIIKQTIYKNKTKLKELDMPGLEIT